MTGGYIPEELAAYIVTFSIEYIIKTYRRFTNPFPLCIERKMGDNMKAVHYEGPFKVSVKEIPRPTLSHPDDAIIKVTTSGVSQTPSSQESS